MYGDPSVPICAALFALLGVFLIFFPRWGEVLGRPFNWSKTGPLYLGIGVAILIVWPFVQTRTPLPAN
jgi:hypothetical protein